MKKARTFAHSRQGGAGPAVAQKVLAEAYRSVFSTDDGEIVLADIARLSSYYYHPKLTEWVAAQHSPADFPLYCAVMAARAEITQHILDFLTLDDAALQALERAARAEVRR